MRNLVGGPLVLAALLLLTLGACGGGGNPPPPTLPVGPPVQPKPLWSQIVDGPAGTLAWATDTCGLAGAGSDASFMGGYWGSVTLSPGTPEARTLPSTSLEDSYLCRSRASDGRNEWAVTLNASAGGWAIAQDLCETPSGIVGCGFFNGDVTLNNQAGLPVGVLFGEADDDGFVAHYDRNGFLQWARALTGPGYVECLSVATRNDGSVVVGGIFDDVATVGGPGDTLTPAGLQDSFLSAYSPIGTYLWSTQFESDATSWISVWGVASIPEPGQDLIVSGDFQGTITFAAGEMRTSVGGSIDSFIARIDGTTGDLEWLQTITGTGNEQSLDVVVGVQGGNTFVRLAGGFEDTATFGELPGPQQMLTSAGFHDGFVAAFNGAGSLQWARSVGGTEEDFFSDVWVRGSDGAVMASGYFTDECRFSGSPVELFSHGMGDVDALLAGFDSDGTVDWAFAMGGVENDYGLGISEVPGAPGDVYVSGSARGSNVMFGVGLPPVDFHGDRGAFQLRFTVE